MRYRYSKLNNNLILLRRESFVSVAGVSTLDSRGAKKKLLRGTFNGGSKVEVMQICWNALGITITTYVNVVRFEKALE